MKDGVLAVRISKEELKKFERKALNAGKKSSEFIREIIKAANDDRLRIIPTDGQKSIYLEDN